MKVHELIKKLSGMNPNAEMVVAVEEGDEPLHDLEEDDVGEAGDPVPVVVIYSGWPIDEPEKTKRKWKKKYAFK